MAKTAYGLDSWSPTFPPHIGFDAERIKGWKQGMAGKKFEDLFEWRGTKDAHGPFPCFEPGKDIVLPMYKVRKAAQPRPPGAKRSRLFFFAGELGRGAHAQAGRADGRPEFQYSHGLRQALAKLWMGREDVGMHIHAGHYKRYYADLQDSVFCGVLPGDGWSGAIIDYLNNGCIPVHLHDTVTSPFEGYLDIQEFSLKVPEVNLTNLPYLLADVPEWRVRELQEGGRRVNSRFTYGSYHEKMAAVLRRVGAGPLVGVPEKLGGPDALETLMSILFRKLEERGR